MEILLIIFILNGSGLNRVDQIGIGSYFVKWVGPLLFDNY